MGVGGNRGSGGGQAGKRGGGGEVPERLREAVEQEVVVAQLLQEDGVGPAVGQAAEVRKEADYLTN